MPDAPCPTQAALFEAGLAAGLDPESHRAPADKVDPASRRSVTLRSPWRFCVACRHSFRVGDEVLAIGDGQAVHDMPGLRCAGAGAGGPEAGPGNSDFYAGLDEAWPAPEGVHLNRLEAGHPLLAPALQGLARASCRICAHTFRLGDQVIVCPCSPERPRCRAAVHRDTLKQLHCWEEWERARGADVCLGMT